MSTQAKMKTLCTMSIEYEYSSPDGIINSGCYLSWVCVENVIIFLRISGSFGTPSEIFGRFADLRRVVFEKILELPE